MSISESTVNDISIHAPLTGSDSGARVAFVRHADFNPRSPYGERLDTNGYSKINVQFQSTLPLRGATICRTAAMLSSEFQSTLPLRGATNTS